MSEFPSDDFGTGPNASATFGDVPQDAEPFRIVQNSSERKSDHTLTVREVARMFEDAGVARTERSITNWCQPNKTGIARLDAFFDSNERKYFITPRSVEIAIQEEQSKDRTRIVAKMPTHGTSSEEVRNASAATQERDTGEIEQLRREVLDLKILNQGKDFYINKLQEEREQFANERKDYVATLMKFNRRVGQLETRLGIEPPSQRLDTINSSEDIDTEIAA